VFLLDLADRAKLVDEITDFVNWLLHTSFIIPQRPRRRPKALTDPEFFLKTLADGI
jgi:hypothetical protein